ERAVGDFFGGLDQRGSDAEALRADGDVERVDEVRGAEKGHEAQHRAVGLGDVDLFVSCMVEEVGGLEPAFGAPGEGRVADVFVELRAGHEFGRRGAADRDGERFADRFRHHHRRYICMVQPPTDCAAWRTASESVGWAWLVRAMSSAAAW